MKTAVMLLGLALVTGAGLACFGMFSDSKDSAAIERSCEGLTGQAKIDCEKRDKP